MRYRNSWFDALVVGVGQVAKNVVQLQILPANGATESFTVGSHIDVSVLVNGKTEIRSYSLVGEHVPNEPYTIAVKRLPESRGGSTYMWSLKIGHKIKISQPNNNFELGYNTNDYLMIAAGIGITPIVGMVKTLSRKEGARVQLLYVGSSQDEMPFIEDLKGVLKDTVYLHYSGTMGRYDTSKLIDLVGEKTQIYLCGPLPFMNAVRKTWEEGPYENSNLRFETFGASGLFAPQIFRVEIPRYNKVLNIPSNQSMLQVLQSEGIDVLHDCQKGECGLCQIDVLECSGVIDHSDYFFSEAEKGENKKMCACVSRVAKGSIIIDTGYRGGQI